MGAIVSYKKDPRKSRVEQKAIAVNAFSSTSKDGTAGGTAREEPPYTKQTESSPGGSNANLAVSSWGEGVVGTSSHSLHTTGEVTSRGVGKDVTSSKDLYPGLKSPTADLNRNEPKRSFDSTSGNKIYTAFATVTPLKPEEAAVVIQSTFRGYITRKDISKQREASVVIQRHIRGHQARRDLRSQENAATLIQTKYRTYCQNKDSSEDHMTVKTAGDGTSSDEEEDENKLGYRKPWNEATPSAPVLDKNVQIGKKTKESFQSYQGDITDLKWKTEQQLEKTTMGESYVPPRILLIASNIPRADVLQLIVREDIIKICYDFNTTTLETLLEKIHEELANHQVNSKARSIGFVCSGGPGCINPVKGKVVTKAKLKHDQEMTSFWKTLGTKMTKLEPLDDVIIHVIGNNVTGNKQGVKLLKFLSKLMRPSIVEMKSPLEMSTAGKEMLEMYFDHLKYRTWRSRMHSKVAFAL